MTTIFGHGRLRLYLLKLLDESPRHGYEIISLLRDRFLGIYSPSPGTIYPRLARLEEEGLVTHEEVNGRKVYRLTDKGRAELRERERDLEDLERQITESVRDIAQAVQRDVRDTISHLREELKAAAQHTRRSRSERQESAKTGADDVWSRAADEQEERRDGEREHGFAWNREWEKFAHTFGWPRPKGLRTAPQAAGSNGSCTTSPTGSATSSAKPAGSARPRSRTCAASWTRRSTSSAATLPAGDPRRRTLRRAPQTTRIRSRHRAARSEPRRRGNGPEGLPQGRTLSPPALRLGPGHAVLAGLVGHCGSHRRDDPLVERLGDDVVGGEIVAHQVGQRGGRRELRSR